MEIGWRKSKTREEMMEGAKESRKEGEGKKEREREDGRKGR